MLIELERAVIFCGLRAFLACERAQAIRWWYINVWARWAFLWVCWQLWAFSFVWLSNRLIEVQAKAVQSRASKTKPGPVPARCNEMTFNCIISLSFWCCCRCCRCCCCCWCRSSTIPSDRINKNSLLFLSNFFSFSFLPPLFFSSVGLSRERKKKKKKNWD